MITAAAVHTADRLPPADELRAAMGSEASERVPGWEWKHHERRIPGRSGIGKSPVLLAEVTRRRAERLGTIFSPNFG
jgi:hypothetical protein